MIVPECQQSFDRLMRYFAWLVEDYHFVIIHSETGTMGYCGFVLQSGDCRFFMDVERGFAQFGQLALAPAAKQLDAFTPESRRYTVKEVLDYLRGWYLSWPQIEERNQLLDRMPAEESLMKLSAECQDLWPKVMELFQQHEFNRRHEELEEFLKKMNDDLHQQHIEYFVK